LSRSRLAELIRAGHLTNEEGAVLSNPSAKVPPGAVLQLSVPEPVDDYVRPEAIPLDILYEDDHMLLVNKPAGMVVHPAPGAREGTLVAALLSHCGDTLSGVGGVKRPGIVHRIDKDTSGVLAVAKSDAAHHGLAAQFAAHSARRLYRAVAWGDVDAKSTRLKGLSEVSMTEEGLTISAPIARHPVDRKRMAVRAGGKHAVTHVKVRRRFGALSEITCELETGRTHQIRVHMARIGHPLLGDQVYGRARQLPSTFLGAGAVNEFLRQALHAEYLGVSHPISGVWIEGQAPLPEDMFRLETEIAQNL